MRIRLNLSYDGADFRGWQIQPDVRTVQGEIEKALQSFYGGQQIRIQGSGRTDTGVHAIGQVAHYDTDIKREEQKIVRGLNSLLPDSIHIWRARQVEDRFHSRFDAFERTYCYRLLNRYDIFENKIGWTLPKDFDAEIAIEASKELLGVRDFRNLSTQPEPDESTICDLKMISWRKTDNGYLVFVVANRFLRRMVRTIIGTLVDLGSGRYKQSDFKTIFSKDFRKAGVPAPAQGLALLRVKYIVDDEGDCPTPSPWGEVS